MSFKIVWAASVAGVGTIITAWLGGWDAALRALVAFMVLDYVTGFIAAVWHHRVDSEVMFKGGIRKGVILAVVMMGVWLDAVVGNAAPIFRTMIVYYYVAREGLSVLENIGLLGVPLPQILIDTLAQLQSPGNENDKSK